MPQPAPEFPICLTHDVSAVAIATALTRFMIPQELFALFRIFGESLIDDYKASSVGSRLIYNLRN